MASLLPLSDNHIRIPLRLSEFEKELQLYPDKAWSSRLLQAIKCGVSLGFIGPHTPHLSRNIASATKHPDVICAELEKEVTAGRVLGPLEHIPMETFRSSGLGAIPKKGGKWMMILHLSAPLGNSVNDGIDKDQFPIQYSTVDKAISLVTSLGAGAVMAMVDLQAAFRMVPVSTADWDHLGIQWQGKYYVDTCLPFGLRSAPFLFNQFAEALNRILCQNYQVTAIHYLDDFLMVGTPGSDQCVSSIRRTLAVCDRLGVPVALHKLEEPSTTITFLAIQLDSVAQVLSLPSDKVSDITTTACNWLGRRTATKRELLSLIGKLSFATKVVPAGRLFLRRLIDLSTTVDRLHHHLHIGAEARADLEWWAHFLPQWNDCAKFLEPQWSSPASLKMYTDASGSHGFGAYFDRAWLRGTWSPHQTLPHHSIQWQELFTILVAASAWSQKLCSRRVTFHCDN